MACSLHVILSISIFGTYSKGKCISDGGSIKIRNQDPNVSKQILNKNKNGHV